MDARSISEPALRRWLIAAVLAAAALLLGLFVQGGTVLAADRAVARPLVLTGEGSPPALIAIMQAISWLGGGIPRWAMVVLLCAALWRWVGRRPAVLLAMTALAANLTSSLLKNLYDRPRPDLVPHLDHVSSFSYPSGHAISVTAIAVAFALLVPQPWRRKGVGLAAAAVLLTGLSRVMLGVHWPSDVLGGSLLGVAFALAIAGRGHAAQRQISAGPAVEKN